MASRTLYPPTIAASLPAFLVSKETLKVPISFSKFNNLDEFTSAQVSISKKDTGMSVVKTTNDASRNRYRATGIILNVPVLSENINGETIYYLEISADDLSSQANGYVGWIPSWYYKIQVRLSALDYPGTGGQQEWLNTKASEFSEWSTICIVKAIGDIDINLTSFNYNYSTRNSKKEIIVTNKALTFIGNYECVDPTETLGYYRIKIYNYPKTNESVPLDDSGYIYNDIVNTNEINYTFKNNWENHNIYLIEFEYNTINDFNETLNIKYTLSMTQLDAISAEVISLDNDEHNILKDLTTLGEENDEGRIGLKLYSDNDASFSGNLVIRRSTSRDCFSSWEDIKIIKLNNQKINSVDMWYDYTIESGIWYKYGVQAVNRDNERSPLVISEPVMRNFNYSYLLGENNQQLKLMFDYSMDSFNRQMSDSFVDTIGGKYPIFSRNTATDYKTFPVNGTISFFMDEKNTFTNKKLVYNGTDIVNLYNNYNEENDIYQYDYIYEREFRNLVSDFLHDGKPKLFKSPTEGNIIIRLMEVGMSPKQELSRIIYSFSANAYELADNTVNNYKKYKILDFPKIDNL